jgi:hypothetical protein
MAWYLGNEFLKPRPLASLRRGMINLEDRNSAQLRQAIGPTVVTRSKNDNLIETLVD